MCGQCEHWKGAADTMGRRQCYYDPPKVLQGGTQRRPWTDVGEPSCGHFRQAGGPPPASPAARAAEPGAGERLGPEETRRIVERMKETGEVRISTAPAPKWAPKGKRKDEK